MMEKMDNNKKENSKITRKPTAAQLQKKEEAARQRIAFNLDNYTLATDVSLAIIQTEGVSEEVKNKANEVLLATLDKMLNL